MFNFFRRKKKPANGNNPKEAIQINLTEKMLESIPGLIRIPDADIALMRFIRVGVAKGIPVVIQAAQDEKTMQENARILRDCYGLSDVEVMIETGIWVGEPEGEKK